jgi:hypothetical protein
VAASMRLMRTWYKTDASDEDPEYVGAFSGEIPKPKDGEEIVGVNWSERGWVEVTYLLPWR